ncbi:hypothetical protein RhiirC2_785445 [Rhizophagus irregularis]|uniref:Uncharacterized protein n=1 Tax=Rhizophagus irregularis TaxID=588596 RepID=A0A2N1MW96_9GLOM|nr:hypothetical protein RhiirC2_785445 [Rhizophagus irregularis]
MTLITWSSLDFEFRTRRPALQDIWTHVENLAACLWTRRKGFLQVYLRISFSLVNGFHLAFLVRFLLDSWVLWIFAVCAHKLVFSSELCWTGDFSRSLLLSSWCE